VETGLTVEPTRQDPVPSVEPVSAVSDLAATANEVEADPFGVEDEERPGPRRINLAEILLSDIGGTRVEQRIEVVCRLVARLVEKANLPESEVIEALIKSDIEF
jgi:hypothetical protein